MLGKLRPRCSALRNKRGTDSTEAGLHITELTLDHPKRMLDLRTQMGNFRHVSHDGGGAMDRKYQTRIIVGSERKFMIVVYSGMGR